MPSAACMIRVSKALPLVWLKTQVNQNVPAKVPSSANGGSGFEPEPRTNGRCYPVTSSANMVVAISGDRVT